MGRMQQAHLAMLTLVPVLYAILRITSNPQDPFVSRIAAVLLVVGTFWTAYVAVFALRVGDRNGVVLNFLTWYRQVLHHWPSLVASTVALLTVSTTLLVQLALYRSVTFESNQDVDLHVREEPGRSRNLGQLRAGQASTHRLKIGVAEFTYSDLGGTEYVNLPPITIGPLWREVKTVRITVPEWLGQRDHVEPR